MFLAHLHKTDDDGINQELTMVWCTQYLNVRITSSTEHYRVVKTWMMISSEPDSIVWVKLLYF